MRAYLHRFDFQVKAEATPALHFPGSGTAPHLSAGARWPYAWMRPLVRQAIGRVALWGDVVEGARGWRASRAYPAELWLPQLDIDGHGIADVSTIALDLADYGVPVI